MIELVFFRACEEKRTIQSKHSKDQFFIELITVSMNAGIKVFAPATVANMACGFDILGFALEKPGDEVIARFSETPGLRITSITGTKGKKLPYEIQKNTAGYAAWRLLEHLGETERGIELEIRKKMPFGYMGIRVYG